MFSELNKYENKGHFFFEHGKNLKELLEEVPDLPGIYYVISLSNGMVDIVYIGKTETKNQNAKSLKGELNSKLTTAFSKKYKENKIEALDIYWFVTIDNENQDLPEYVEGKILQQYFEIYGSLPPWNK